MNSEELLQRAAEERHAIVQKYLKGREEGAEIDAWEEPFAIYHSLDRFGFVQDEKNHEQQALSQKALIEQKEKELEMERAKKWYKMFLSWKKVSPDKLKRRVYKGIPNACRGVAWALLLNVQDEIRDHPRKYEEMLDLAYKYSPDIRQIDLDVNRTYREHIFFRDRYGGKQKELFNVLAAYSVYNLEIGYCQGMSQIAALLLMYLSEQDAFWALSKLVIDPKYCMHGFFIPGFPKLLRYQEHHDKIMAKFLSKLKKHLDKNSVDTGIYTLKWFFQCFLDRIPFKLTLRVWDIYLLEGERIMSAMAYNLLKMHKNQLYKLNMDDILHFIQVKLEKQFEYSEDATIDSLQKCLEELRRNKLDYAGKPPAAELPKTKLGIFKPDAHSASLEQKVGRRTEFSSVEKSTQETVITRRDTAVAMATMLSDRNSSIGTDGSKYDPDSRENSEYSPALSDRSVSPNGTSKEYSEISPSPVSNRTTTYSQAPSDRTTSRETSLSLNHSPALSAYGPRSRTDFEFGPVPVMYEPRLVENNENGHDPTMNKTSRANSDLQQRKHRNSASLYISSRNTAYIRDNELGDGNSASECSSDSDSDTDEVRENSATENSRNSTIESRNFVYDKEEAELNDGNSASDVSSLASDGEIEGDECRGNSAKTKSIRRTDELEQNRNFNISFQQKQGKRGPGSENIRNSANIERNFGVGISAGNKSRNSAFQTNLEYRNSAINKSRKSTNKKEKDELDDVSSIGSMSSRNSTREAGDNYHIMNDNTSSVGSVSSSQCPSSVSSPTTPTSRTDEVVSFTHKRSFRSSFRKRRSFKDKKEYKNSSSRQGNVSVRGVSFRKSPEEDSGYADSKCSADGDYSDRSTRRGEHGGADAVLVTHL
uniref:USP6 N-terminal-like protein n=1 Tax=Cacopsylla melanoneura TaxID=428564 RepID=A0A8D8VK27_9HEMI